MKIKSIAAICKKNKQVVLFNRYSDGRVYVRQTRGGWRGYIPEGAGQRLKDCAAYLRAGMKR